MIVHFLAEVWISGWLFSSFGIPVPAVSWLLLVHVFSSCFWSLALMSLLFCVVCSSTVFFICSKSQRISRIVHVLDKNTPMLGSAVGSASSRPAAISTCSESSTLSGITTGVAVTPSVFEGC